ncbi:hypothetical protein [Solibacillus cecembensis]|uniref:hypothetical protein n=1 Tax=Solibacillus cecembensis TaxID=459347 RepID=UPI003D03259C
MKFSKWVLASAITLGLGGTIFTPANAASTDTSFDKVTDEEIGTVYGGWSEDTGYFTNSSLLERSISLLSTPNHSAERQWNEGTTLPYERIVATTTWDGVYHYSRARYENLFGNVEADSKRVYGTGKTKATSGWHSGGGSYAGKSYYGVD